MKHLSRLIYYWLPPLIWMTIIFYLSSRTRIITINEYIVSFIIFKTLHVIEYGLLYFLTFRAFYSLSDKKINRQKKFILPLIISILYAVSDEIHQKFVPSREGRIRDILIDSLGVYLMYIYIKNNLKSLRKLI